MPRLRSIASFLFVIAFIPGLALAERKATLVGKIVDPAGKPIQGVTVTVTSPDIPDFKQVLVTDKKGVFTVDVSKTDVTYQYRFDKAGYLPVESRQQWNKEGTEFHDWTMPLATVEAGTMQGAAPASTSGPAIEAFNTGLAAFKAKEYATAEKEFLEAVAHDANLRQAWAALSVVHLQLGHDQQATAAAERAIALGSTEDEVFQARWQAYRNLKDEAKAAEALKDLEKIGRRTEEAKKIHNEAVALAKAGDNAGAFAKFQEALKVAPNLQASLLGLATAGVKIGRNAEAATAAETILKTDPKNEAATRVRYNAYLSLGDKARLVESLVGLAAFEPVIARNGLLRLAFEAYDANDLVAAKERFGKVLQVDPNYPQAYYYLGVINAGQGAMAEAKRQIERFLQLAPKDPEANSARDMLKYLSKP